MLKPSCMSHAVFVLVQAEEMVLRSGNMPSKTTQSLDAVLATHANVCRLDAFPQPPRPTGGITAGFYAEANSQVSAQGSPDQQQPQPQTSSKHGNISSQTILAATAVDMAALAATLAQDLDSSDSEECD